MNADGMWIVTEDTSYSAVVANPSDEATKKLEKLKVNDTTYANWTEDEIQNIASEVIPPIPPEKKLYKHKLTINVPQAMIRVYDATGTAATVYTDGELYYTTISNSVAKITVQDLCDELGGELGSAAFYSGGPTEGDYRGVLALQGFKLSEGYYVKAYGAVTNGAGKPFAVYIINVDTISDNVIVL